MLGQLIRGYTKRQQWLARIQAIEVARVLFGEPGPEMVSSEEMLALLPQA